MTATESKSQLAYDFIKQRIVSGRFTPGFRLVLATIAGELGASVVPMREAVCRLEAEGLVTFERNVGAQVAMVDEREYLHTMQTLALVEGYATALSAPLLSGEHIARARDVNEGMARSLEHFEPHAFTAHNLQFHAMLFEVCPNPHMLDLVHRGWNRMVNLRDSTFGFVPGRARQSVNEHERLLELIEGDAPATEIESAAREHPLGTLDAFLAYQDSRPMEQH